LNTPVLLMDVMDTLVRDPFHEELPRAFGHDKESFLRHKRDGLWPKFERGEIDEGTFIRRCLLDEEPPSVERVHRHLRKGYRWMPGMESLMSMIPDRIPVYALSNYPVWFRLIEEELSLSRYLDWRFVSWKTGLRKPSQQAYTRVLEQLGVRPRNCIFVDNSAENCRPARLLGIRVHQYEGTRRLKKFLDQYLTLGVSD
jgi:HAD superfamily hydrolase (TIGR01509 family)